ncbi:hypothetical protein BO94DRAFT_208913 [Aspergillus sclerotioniger CBS 115572]|uniref:Uncharacterized protein n=1 Tax=Aspergillus sclerotioniger CBS 115572 TaxID=1450535 RepID=A0A317VRC1_9EURO|nr:hypothetical protein BO94DRAFT_208913 [Aspergillus sclerotioniger CBS 115572]PWY76109.1 hypothetical protein BO94DRAFT_208913 [Aspergillus sclerotioniger CBS 115572]
MPKKQRLELYTIPRLSPRISPIFQLPLCACQALTLSVSTYRNISHPLHNGRLELVSIRHRLLRLPCLDRLRSLIILVRIVNFPPGSLRFAAQGDLEYAERTAGKAAGGRLARHVEGHVERCFESRLDEHLESTGKAVGMDIWRPAGRAIWKAARIDIWRPAWVTARRP